MQASKYNTAHLAGVHGDNGTCIRIAFVEPGCTSHSQEYLDAGKTQMAHDAVVCSAKILAAAAYELVAKPELMEEIKQEFAANKAKG